MNPIQRYLGAAPKPPPGTENPYREMLASVIEGIGTYAVRGDSNDYQGFRDTLAWHRASLTKNQSPDQFRIETGLLLGAVRDYNRRVALHLQSSSRERQNIIALLVETIVKMSAPDAPALTKLQELEKQIDQATSSEELRLLEQRLPAYLDGLLSHHLHRQQAAAPSPLTVGERAGDPNIKPTDAISNIDDATGLPPRASAECRLAELLESGEPAHAVLFCLTRLHVVNARFGREIGDQALVLFSQHLARHLPLDPVYRWSGPTFLAVLRRNVAVQKLKAELAPVTAAKLETNVETRGRSALLPITFTWAVFPLAEQEGLIPLIRSIDTFSGAQFHSAVDL